MGQTEERALIGALLTDNDRIDDVQTFITSEMFTDEICSMLYNLVIRSYRDGNEIDGVTLASKVKSEIYPQEIVSRTISECILDCTTSVMAEEYAKCIYKDYLVRKSGDLVNKFRPDNTNVVENLQKLVDDLEGLQLVTSHKDYTLKDAIRDNKNKCFNPNREQGISLGIDDIDMALLGLDPGDVCIVGARPSVGKSALSIQIAKNIARNGFKTSVFNLEMTNEQVYQRMIAAESGISLARIRRGLNFLNDEQKRFEEGNRKLEQIQENMFLYDDVYKVSEMRKHLKKNKSDIAIIDYAQLIVPEGDYKGNRTAEVGQISRNVKKMAKELGIPIILLCQLNRLSIMKDNSEPTMAELREAGDFEQDASQILLLWNANEDRTLKGWKIDKNRNGIITKSEMYYDGAHMTFKSFGPLEEGDSPFVS